MLDLVQAAGFTTIRDECYWSEVEKSRGSFEFPRPVDNYIQAAKRRGIDVLLILNYNNPLYAPHAGSAVTTDSNRIAFARYCQEVVKRYSPLGIKYYEIWNEPNIPMFWDPTPNAGDYVKLLETAYPAIKLIDPSVTVMGCATSPAEGNPAPFIDWITFITRVFQAGGRNYMDAVSYHQYHVDQRPEVNFFKDIQKLQAIIGTDKPIWLTEIGYPTNTGWPNINLEKQADYCARTFLLGKTVGTLQLISYYDLKNDGENPAEPEHNFGVLYFNRQPKPAYHALKTVATVIADKPVFDKTILGDVYLFEFGESQDWVAAIWRSTGQSVQKIKLRDRYCSSINRDGKLDNYWISSDSSIAIDVNESPRYLCGVSSAPKLNSLNVQPNRVILYPNQSFEISVSGIDTADVPVNFMLSALDWKYEGTGGTVDSQGRFTAEGAGKGLLIGSIQGLSDTIFVGIVNPGTHLIDDFNVTDHWKLTTLNVDSLKTKISISDSTASSGTTSGRIDYHFAFKSSISSSSYRVNLNTNLMFPGEPDSLLIDFRGNGQPHRLRFQVVDAFGEQFIRSVSAPLNWNAEWRKAKISLKNLPGKVDYPLSLNQITIYLGQDNAQNDSSYHGTIYLDNLRVKSNLGTSVSEFETEKPQHFKLYQNLPNPFNPRTTIHYSLDKSQFVTLKVFNLMGQEVATLVSEFQNAGDHFVQFNGENLANGLYYYRLEVGERHAIKKMLLLR